MRRRVARARLIGAGLALALVSGCGTLPSSLMAQVPTSGPIDQGDQVAAKSGDQFIRVIAREPRPDMTPAQVVQGFLDASASFDGDHAVARQYLTAEASRDWDTAAGVSVYEGVGTLGASAGLVTLTAALAGTISENGRYEVADSGSVLNVDFSLVRASGEWRIDEVPPGLVLSLSDVDRAFRSLAVYFFDPGFNTLVPDPRMVPVIGPGQATTLVRDLIDGPSEWLGPAVRTGFPDGVALSFEAVPVEGGVAVVDLTPSARLADDSSRRAMSQQLVWTLRQVPGVNAVEISVGGVPLLVPGVGSPQPRDAWPEVDPSGLLPGSDAFFERDGLVVKVDGQRVTPVAGAAGSGEARLIDIAISRSGQRLAGVDAQGTLWTGEMRQDGTLDVLLVGRQPMAPAFDRSNAVWVVDQELGLITISADGRVVPVPLRGLPKEATLLQAVPSRDGTRVALVVQIGPRRSLLVGVIVRSTLSSDPQVTNPISVESRLTEVLDVSWADPDALAVVGSDGAGSMQVFEVDIARGSVTGLGGPVEPFSVAAAPGMPTLVAASDGVIYRISGGAWRAEGLGTAPAYPG